MQLREAHERSLSALRCELEPKVRESRTLAEERERLTNELTATRANAERMLADRETTNERELARAMESASEQHAAQQRIHSAELTRVS